MIRAFFYMLRRAMSNLLKPQVVPQQPFRKINYVRTYFQETVAEELRLSKYIRQLEVFSQLRNLQNTVYQKKSAMDFIYDIEKDPVYKEGEKRGEEQGEKRKTLVIAQAMKQTGESIGKIIAYTQLRRK